MLVLVLLGVILLALAGFNVGGPRFSPQWLGFACLALALFWTPVTAAIGG